MKPTAHICQLKLFQHVPNITLVGGNRRNFSSSTLIRVIDHNIKTWTLTYCLTFQVSCPTSCSYHLLPECNRFSLKSYLMWAIPHSSYQSASNDSNLTTHFMWHFYAIRGSSFWPLSIAVNNARHHTRFLLDASRHHLRYLAFFNAYNLSLESSLTMLVSTGLQVTSTCRSDRKISGKNRIRLKHYISYDI